MACLGRSSASDRGDPKAETTGEADSAFGLVSPVIGFFAVVRPLYAKAVAGFPVKVTRFGGVGDFGDLRTSLVHTSEEILHVLSRPSRERQVPSLHRV